MFSQQERDHCTPTSDLFRGPFVVVEVVRLAVFSLSWRRGYDTLACSNACSYAWMRTTHGTSHIVYSPVVFSLSERVDSRFSRRSIKDTTSFQSFLDFAASRRRCINSRRWALWDRLGFAVTPPPTIPATTSDTIAAVGIPPARSTAMRHASARFWLSLSFFKGRDKDSPKGRTDTPSRSQGGFSGRQFADNFSVADEAIHIRAAIL